MNVLALTSSYPRFAGDPTAPFVESITRHLAALGHPTHLVLPESAEWSRPPGEDGITYHPYRYSPRRSWTPWGYSASLVDGVAIKRSLYALAPLVVASALRTCDRVASREAPDLVHVHWVVPNGPIGGLVARRRRLPLVISLHGSDLSVAQRSRWMGRATRWSFAYAAAVTAPSQDMLERARRLGATGRLELAPYGVDPEAFRPDEKTALRVRAKLGLDPEHVTVLGIGRFIGVKGFEYLVDAVARARESAPSIRLVLVGDGALSGELRARAARNGLGDEAIFAGMVSPADVPGYVAAADLVAVPSVHYEGYVDGLPNVALEAMGAGKPLVATRVGGLPQVVDDGTTGLLVPERDAEALARAILRLAGDAELRRRMGEAARTRVEEGLTWDAVARRFERLYRDVLDA
jgi:glycosyltransferase involved in cell wall biosynthesis